MRVRVERRQMRLTRVAFGVIIVFVLAQVVWWLLFQHRYIDRVTRAAEHAWSRDAETATLLAERAPELTADLLERYPHLRPDGAGGFTVDSAALREFERQQRRHLRMFWFEGPFFVLVVMTGLLIIGRSLAAERELKRRQQNFLSAVTHEFRTPLSTLRLLIETVQYRRPDPQRLQDYLRRMEREVARLEGSSDRVLASARLEQRDGPPILRKVDLNAVVEGIIGKARPGLETRGAELRVEYSPEPLPVSLEPDAFEVVLNNLLDNAVKYSPGPVKPVRVTLERREHLVVLQVEDEGVGVPEAEAEQIFERFYRPGSEMTRASQGVGLGLHLVRTIVEAMNGWVRCEPNREAGRGTRFTVVLPARVGRADPERTEARDQEPGGGHPAPFRRMEG